MFVVRWESSLRTPQNIHSSGSSGKPRPHAGATPELFRGTDTDGVPGVAREG